jgi:hypothetical protein
MPIVTIAVMIAIQITPTRVTQNVLAAAPFAPKRRNVYEPAICARFAITTMSATTIAQPPNQPRCGPSARVTHENVVPQSGSRGS